MANVIRLLITYGYRHRKPWEPDFAEDMRIADKCIRRLIQTIGKIVPSNNSGKIKKRLWQPVCRDFRNLTEDHGKDKRCKNRLNQEPKRPKYRLLVYGHKIPPHKKHNEITVSP